MSYHQLVLYFIIKRLLREKRNLALAYEIYKKTDERLRILINTDVFPQQIGSFELVDRSKLSVEYTTDSKAFSFVVLYAPINFNFHLYVYQKEEVRFKRKFCFDSEESALAKLKELASQYRLKSELI